MRERGRAVKSNFWNYYYGSFVNIWKLPEVAYDYKTDTGYNN